MATRFREHEKPHIVKPLAEIELIANGTQDFRERDPFIAHTNLLKIKERQRCKYNSVPLNVLIPLQAYKVGC